MLMVEIIIPNSCCRLKSSFRFILKFGPIVVGECSLPHSISRLVFCSFHSHFLKVGPLIILNNYDEDSSL